ncbi:MAG: EAL domain-containing protein, partial [Roseovarius sp.]|uniref:putative bifunctional diguanylate cyclase/phosphodiesterase n=1 Tax=Roseovarius sp. TaxID=1486281 RepID=UPI0032EC726C
VAVQMSGRLQTRVEEPVSLDAQAVYLSCSLGFVLDSQLRGANAQEMLTAANLALEVARANAPSAIRAYAPDMAHGPTTPDRLADELASALEKGQIVPWFQPQLSTDTGLVSGFEALARWHHPQRGVLLPGTFLPHIEKAGLTGTLQAIMLREALEALGRWQEAGFTIPGVGVNFSPTDLRDPALADTVAWELDRHDLAPSRLKIEILETVVSTSPDDETARNIRRLSDLGCRIDLDDFGTGHASISSLKRFSIDRLKIDRSFVRGIDTDPRQQRMVAAILTMAEQLELETLAEGVETAGEHSLLAQLGCAHVQGFGIARPMPPEATLPWLRTHTGKLQAPPDLRKGAV